MFKDGFLYFIDFGLSTFYLNEKRQHIPDGDDGSHLTGTPKWMSYYIHTGHRASRRDDLISLGYVFMFLLRGGNLPWEEDLYRAEKKELNVLISETNNDILCNYFQLCYALDFSEEPNYCALKDILKNNIKE